MSIFNKARDKLSRKHSRNGKRGFNIEKHPFYQSPDQKMVPEPHSNYLALYAGQCDDLVRSSNDIESQISTLQAMHRRMQSSLATGDAAYEIETLSKRITNQSEVLIGRLRSLKAHPGAETATYASHSGRAESRLRAVMVRFAEVERDHRSSLRRDLERQYLIISPDATEDEVKAACDNDQSQQQIFAQAFMHEGGRVANSKIALKAVDERHEAIQKVESQLVEIAELFQAFEGAVIEQGNSVQYIDAQAETTKENVEFAALNLDEATETAKAARRKKWVAFWTYLGIVVIVIAVVAVVAACA